MSEALVTNTFEDDQRDEASISTMSLEAITNELGTNEKVAAEIDARLKNLSDEAQALKALKAMLFKRRTHLKHASQVLLDGETLF